MRGSRAQDRQLSTSQMPLRSHASFLLAPEIFKHDCFALSPERMNLNSDHGNHPQLDCQFFTNTSLPLIMVFKETKGLSKFSHKFCVASLESRDLINAILILLPFLGGYHSAPEITSSSD